MMFCLYGWMIIATRFIDMHSPAAEKINLKRQNIHFIILSFLLLLHIIENALLILGLFFPFIIFPMLYMCGYVLYSTATALVEAEKYVLPHSNSKTATMFQLFYLPFCIYWIHKRLKKIASDT